MLKHPGVLMRPDLDKLLKLLKLEKPVGFFTSSTLCME